MPILKPDWIERFTLHLHQIRPLQVGHEAHAIAVSLFDEDSDLTPEEAAEVYASQDPPAGAVAPE